jgi:thioredoxin reductase
MPDQQHPAQQNVDVVVIGAGPAGLTLAHALGELGISDVLIIDRDTQPGGVPRYSDHHGYGIRDLRQPLRGPIYAGHLALRAVKGGSRIMTEATVTDISATQHTIEVTAPSGRLTVKAKVIVIATGCRERPRTARLVPGTRPAGVFTTGWLQRLVHLQHGSPGKRAVIVGAEHVSYSAVLTLRHAKCDVVAMVTERRRHDSFSVFNFAARARWRFPLLTSTKVTEILGVNQVTGVQIQDAKGRSKILECDSVVFTGDWVSENELARRAGIEIDPGTGGPAINAHLATNTPGIFAIGNVLHPAATADICALDGAHAAAAIAAYLAAPSTWQTAPLRLLTEGPIGWAAPNLLTPEVLSAPRGKVLVQFTERRRLPRLEVVQGGKRLWSGFVPWAIPTRPVPISDSWLARVSATGADPILRLLT